MQSHPAKPCPNPIPDSTTFLADGTRIAKDAPRMEVIGQINLLTAQIGMAKAFMGTQLPRHTQILSDLQNELCALNRQLSRPLNPNWGAQKTARLDKICGDIDKDLPPPGGDILPAGPPAASALHIARASCHQAERRLISLADAEGHCAAPNDDSFAQMQRYLNQLSKLLLILARSTNLQLGGPEMFWQED